MAYRKSFRRTKRSFKKRSSRKGKRTKSINRYYANRGGIRL